MSTSRTTTGSPFAELIAAVSDHTPPLDRDGYHEALVRLDAKILAIRRQPTKHELRMALHAIYRANVNTRCADLNLSTRF